MLYLALQDSSRKGGERKSIGSQLSISTTVDPDHRTWKAVRHVVKLKALVN